ncbi:unnamed protein product [Parascedosporium putredinis]|uniref:Uncharacterized protein n=1 Tax=Parascedosporium putredinis TaxID=1442378 RepID=A0A9P1GVB9_9PEZI|nr:unnamed protein product [Parascedosporium putredinis]CAI7988362.1 unnamed protein product [Parascedosporium putredinis]
MNATDRTVLKATAMSIDNPKHSTELYQASLDIEPACAIDGKAISHGLSFATGGGEGLVPAQEITSLLDGIRDFFDTKDNCDETFLFAYNKNIAASLHIGAGLGDPFTDPKPEPLNRTLTGLAPSILSPQLIHNSGPPAVFSRIGYYESWNMERECLWLSAKNANTDGTYTYIHWPFAKIDPATWSVVIKDPHGQWSAFKALPNVKKNVSFGG